MQAWHVHVHIQCIYMYIYVCLKFKVNLWCESESESESEVIICRGQGADCMSSLPVRFLNAENEMKRIFGSKVVRADQS